jgi:hypothetical protein
MMHEPEKSDPSTVDLILNALQEQMVRQQIAEHLQRNRACPDCHRPRGSRTFHVNTTVLNAALRHELI